MGSFEVKMSGSLPQMIFEGRKEGRIKHEYKRVKKKKISSHTVALGIDLTRSPPEQD